MREDIGLFRGKRLDNGAWVEGFLRCEKIGDYLTNVFIGENIHGDVWEWHRVAPATVGEYTGLKDRDGRRIFEGNILRIEWHPPGREAVCECHEVVYSKKGFVTKRKGKLQGRVSNCVSQNVNLRCVVIGDVHDNPELLEV